MKWILLTACLVLPSCVFKALDKGLADLRGKPISTAIDVLGYPSSKMDVLEDTVYKWSSSHAGMMAMPHLTSAYGSVGTTPFQMRSSAMSFMPVNHSGEITIGTDKGGIIKRWGYTGTERGLHGYANLLDRYSKSLRKDP